MSAICKRMPQSQEVSFVYAVWSETSTMHACSGSVGYTVHYTHQIISSHTDSAWISVYCGVCANAVLMMEICQQNLSSLHRMESHGFLVQKNCFPTSYLQKILCHSWSTQYLYQCIRVFDFYSSSIVILFCENDTG